MKRELLTVLLIANLCFINLCNAQYNAIKLDGFGALTDRLGLSYERSFSRHFSALLTFEKAKYSTGERNQQEIYKLSGYGLIPEVRYYPFTKNKPAPLGFFMGGALRYANLKETYNPSNINLTGNVVNVGINGGYKFNYKQALFEILAGYGVGQVSGFDLEKRKQIDPFYTERSLEDMKDFFRIEISIGLVFPEVKMERK